MTCKKCGAEVSSSASFCEYCGASVEKSAEPAYMNNPAEQTPQSQPVQTVTPSAEEKPPKKKNLLLGIVGGLIGAALGGASIILVSQMGYVASLCGVLLAFCTLKGYELLGGKPGIPGLLICLALILVTPYLADRIQWAMMVMDAFHDATFIQAFSAVPALLSEGVIESSVYWSSLGQIYLFTAIGAVSIIWSAFKNK